MFFYSIYICKRSLLNHYSSRHPITFLRFSILYLYLHNYLGWKRPTVMAFSADHREAILEMKYEMKIMVEKVEWNEKCYSYH